MTDHLVVARFKKQSESEPTRFTPIMTPDALLERVAKAIPVDMVYLMVSHPDGKGYSLREAGIVGLDIQPVEELQSSLPPLEPPASGPPLASEMISGAADPLPYQVPAPDYSFTSLDDQGGFKFDPPRSQGDLLKERNLDQPRAVKNEVAKKVKKKAKARPADADLDDPSVPDAQLPNPRSNSTTKITGFVKATQAQAAAASKFGARN